MFAMVVVAAALAGASPLPADASRPADPLPAGEQAYSAADGQMLLLAVQMDNETLTESLSAYGDPADPLIPIGELARLLELAVDVQPARGLVTGRIGESLRPLTVDLSARSALIGGVHLPLVPPDSKVTGTDIYLRASLVAKLLPIAIHASPDELLLALTPREKLPVQARRDREARLAGLDPFEVGNEAVLRVENPYRWIDYPALDVGLELGHERGRDRPITRFEGRVSADLLKSAVSGYLSTNDNGALSTARILAQRQSPDGKLLGPLRLTNMAAGDVYAPALSLGPRSTGGAGFTFTSAKNEETSVFERINLRGELPLGYDVELYVNDVLRAGDQSWRSAGRYEFGDVPLLRGRNVIRIVLYGPRGERSEQTRVVNVGGGHLPKGQLQIDGGIVSQDRPLVQFSSDDVVPLAQGRGDVRAVLNLAYGISPTLTATAGAGRYSDMAGGRHTVLTSGMRMSLLGFALQADGARDLDGGSALALGLAGRTAGINFVARHAEYGGAFHDEANSAWDPARSMRRHSELVFDLGLPMPGKASIPFAGRVERSQFRDGGKSLVARGRTTANVADTFFALGLDYSRRSTPTDKVTQFTGNLAATRFIAYEWQLRGSADFDLRPKVGLRSLGVTGDRAMGERYSLRLGAFKSFEGSRTLALQTNFSAHLPFAEATLGADYDTGEKRWRVGLQLNFGLAFDPLRRRYRATRPGPADGGSAAIQAFVDANANGLPDAGEAPVPGLKLIGGDQPPATDARGQAFVTGLGSGSRAYLQTDISAIDTVFLAPPPQAITLAPRPGNVAKILYPLVPTSEVIVKLNFRQGDGALVGLAAVRVVLVSDKGETLPAATEFDGTVVLDSVKPGQYRIELDAEQASRLRMRLVQPLALQVTAQGGAVNIVGEVAFDRSRADAD